MTTTPSRKQLNRWAQIRKEGKTHYAITRGLFGLGIPLLFGGMIIHVWTAPNQNIYSLLGGALVGIPGSLYVGYRIGCRQWDILENRFSNSEAATSNEEARSVPQTEPRVDSQPPRTTLIHKEIGAAIRDVAATGAMAFGALVLIVLCIGGVFGLVALMSPHGRNVTSAEQRPQSTQPDALIDGIARASTESKDAIKDKKERDTEHAIAERQKAKEEAAWAEVHRLLSAPPSTPVNATREAAFLRWKAAREASMRDAATHLQPEQIAAWNKAVAEWNRLTPAQRESRFREEYSRTSEAAILDRK